MTEDLALDLIEKRIADLEKRIIGKSETIENYTPVTDSLLNTNTLLLSAMSGREKIGTVVKRLHDLEKYLAMIYEDRSSSEISAMYEIISLEEPVLRDNVRMINDIQELVPVLNSEHIRYVPQLTKRLEDLILIHLEKKEAVDNLNQDFFVYLEQYNKAIMKLTKAFVQLDEMVTQCEIDSVPKIVQD